jgi:hypothetical protein
MKEGQHTALPKLVQGEAERDVDRGLSLQVHACQFTTPDTTT